MALLCHVSSACVDFHDTRIKANQLTLVRLSDSYDSRNWLNVLFEWCAEDCICAALHADMSAPSPTISIFKISHKYLVASGNAQVHRSGFGIEAAVPKIGFVA
jgi:hypothetical protein